MSKYNDLLARLESEFEKGERRQAVKLLNDFFKKDKKESFERTVCLKQIIRLASEWIDKFETEEVYHIRAGAFFLLKEYESAIANYERAIAINPRYENPFFGKGTTYLELKDYQNALECFTSAIKINPMYFSAYLGRAWVYFVTEDYLAAVQDYTKAIELQPNHETTYYNRGLSYEKLDNFESALEDYRKLLELNLTEDQYLLELTEAKVVELEKKIEDPQYRIINDLVNKIKSILQFDESCVSHYTSLSATKSLILDKSLFRLSEGTYLNDTSEGRELFNYLNLPIKEINLKSSIPEVFFERPFIGSFVSETKHDDLAL